MKKIITFIALTIFSACAFSQNKIKFNETWSYVLTGYENEFSADLPITDLCYFSAEINEYGEIPSIPNRENIPPEFNGRVHLVAICESRSLSHFVIDPKYKVSKRIIKTLAEAKKAARNARTIAVLADMLELGAISEDGHRRVGRWAVENGTDFILTYGNDAAYISEEAKKLGGNAQHCADRHEAANVLRTIANAGDIILLKGSHSMQVDKMLELFK